MRCTDNAGWRAIFNQACHERKDEAAQNAANDIRCLDFMDAVEDWDVT